MIRFNLSNDLFAAYLQNDSEQANTEGINVIANFFNADYGLLFYRNVRNMYKVCITKSGYPISLSADKWHSYIPHKMQSNKIYAIDHWSPPIIENVKAKWYCCKIQTDEANPCYIFVGTTKKTIFDKNPAVTKTGIEIIAKIFAIKHKRDIEIKEKQDSEDQFILIQTRMTSFFETSRDAIYAMNTDEEILSINKSGLSLFGATHPGDVIGKPFSNFTVTPALCQDR